MLNKVILMGRLTREPELKSTPAGNSVCSFSLAVERNFKNGETRIADFISCVAWGGTAEFVSKYFTKGSLLAAEGGIQTRSWRDNDDKMHYVTEVVVSQVYFAESKKSAQEEALSNSELDDGLPF